MINDYEKFVLPDENKEKNVIVEVNWNLKDEKVKGCKVLRFTFPNGDAMLVKREYLNQILFAIGNPEDQRRMIPQNMETVHWRETVLGIKATKDIRKGEMINFPIKISFPCTLVKEVIGEKEWQKNVDKQRAREANALHKVFKP